MPKVSSRELWISAKLAILSALIAGGFGIIHDQITYSISPEYFTRMKFDQFQSADFGFPPRVFVGTIGFLATWWVGLIAGWFLARIAVSRFEAPSKRVIRAVFRIMGVTACFACAGYFVGPRMFVGNLAWQEALESMGVADQTSFHRVAAIHLGSYGGALIGFVVAIGIFLKSPRTR